MFRYDLNGMSPESFAKLCNALLLATISDQVRPFDTVGADGGRDADFEGTGAGAYAAMKGYWVFQYKHHDVSRLGVKEARKAIKRDFDDTLEKICSTKRRQVDNIILITNVPFSGRINVGTHDWLRDRMAKYQLRYAEVWDYTKLEALIDKHIGVKSSFFPDLRYDQLFFKRIVDRISSHVFWEALETLFSLTADSPPTFKSRSEYEACKALLWEIHDDLALVESGISTISNYLISWSEFFDVAEIAEKNPEYEIHLGDEFGIRHGQSWKGGRATIWTIMQTIIGRIDHHSSLAHRRILELAERKPGIARIVAACAREEFEKIDCLDLLHSSDTLITPLQFGRYESVEAALAALDHVLQSKESNLDRSEAAWAATNAFYNAALVTVAMRKGVKFALTVIDASIIFIK